MRCSISISRFPFVWPNTAERPRIFYCYTCLHACCLTVMQKNTTLQQHQAKLHILLYLSVLYNLSLFFALTGYRARLSVEMLGARMLVAVLFYHIQRRLSDVFERACFNIINCSQSLYATILKKVRCLLICFVSVMILRSSSEEIVTSMMHNSTLIDVGINAFSPFIYLHVICWKLLIDTMHRKWECCLEVGQGLLLFSYSLTGQFFVEGILFSSCGIRTS